MDSVNSRTLLECKLRRCMYLGTQYSIYIPPPLRDRFWRASYHTHRYDYHIIKTIGKAVNKNDVIVINSIVPILKKIKQENPLNSDHHLIFALAVCARFNLNQCKQMVRDAYDAINIFCTDGMKILMFVKFCSRAAKMLYDHGYLPYAGSGLNGRGFKNAISKWYSTRNTLETMKLIMESKHFHNMTHKRVLENIRYFTDDPVHKIVIIYIKQTMNDVKEYYKNMRRASKRGCIHQESYYRRNLTFTLINSVYKYLNDYHNKLKVVSDDDIQRLIHFIRLHLIGRQHDALPRALQYDLNYLPAYIEHMPLRSLLDKTCRMAKYGLFYNLRGNEDCLTYINRFNHTSALKKSQIHPIESHITFLKYAKTGEAIVELKKSKNLEWNAMYDCINANVTDNTKSSNENNNDKVVKFNGVDNNNTNNNHTNEFKHLKNDSIFFMKPEPKYSELLKKFLSNDLVEKTLKNIEISSNYRMFIAYDSRPYMATRNCRYPHVKVVKMTDAITMIILSLIYPLREPPKLKPHIAALNDLKTRWKMKKISFKREHLTFDCLKETLFKTPSNQDKPHELDKDIKPVYPLSAMNWARKRKMRYDIFFFVGTHKTDLSDLKRVKAEYSSFLGKRVKTVFCCLSGKHKYQRDFSREGMLFIPGYDRYIGQILQSYINDKY